MKEARHKATYSMILFLEHSGKCKTTVVESRSVTAEVQRAGVRETTTKAYQETFWANGNILYLDCTDDLLNVFVKPHQAMYFKRTNFTECELYLNIPHLKNYLI